MGELIQCTFSFYSTDFMHAPDKSQIELEHYFPSCVDMAKRVLGDALTIRSTGIGYARCITHLEKTPSMRVKPDSVYCFGCGSSWTPSQFYVANFESIGLIPALFHLTDSQLKDILDSDNTYSALELIANEWGIIV